MRKENDGKHIQIGKYKEVLVDGRTISKPTVNKKITMSDFMGLMGLREMDPVERISILENVESVG